MHGRAFLVLLGLGSICASCFEAQTEPVAPPPTYFYPGSHGAPGGTATATTAASSSPSPAPSGAPFPTTIGDALAPFGVIVPPALNHPIPPVEQWGNVPWPFLFGTAPPPAPAPPAAQPPNASPQPSPPSNPVPPPNAAPTPSPVPAPNPNTPVPGDFAGWLPEEIRVLELVNQHRALGGSCGGTQMQAVALLAPNGALMRAARGHSQDMAANDYFDHQSRDGRSPADRATAAGYPSRFVGENIAAGRPTAEGTVQQWLESPGHCVNMLSPEYSVLGVGHATTSRSLGHYWTQLFGD